MTPLFLFYCRVTQKSDNQRDSAAELTIQYATDFDFRQSHRQYR